VLKQSQLEIAKRLNLIQESDADSLKPFVEMVQQCMHEKVELVWGV
jgi:hypothetical protein